MKHLSAGDERLPKYQRILGQLRSRIRGGSYHSGDRLPSEAKLVEEFGASRLTVARALKELQHEGLVVRRAGSGTYVRVPESAKSLVFGLLIPDLGRTEIFEPLCQGMMDARLGGRHSLLWGNSISEGERQEEQAQQLCRHLIERRVSGVFFAPLEWIPAKDEVNRQIALEFDQAGIPVVLLDRCIETYPKRSKYDLVGIDNRRAGYAITQHLLRLGCRRIAFIARPFSAPTVDARIAGYREALFNAGVELKPDLVRRADAGDLVVLRALIREHNPEAYVCANDHAAALLIQALQALGIEVPRGARVAGFDDVKYAGLFPVPLTTIHQPCQGMGAAAVAAMLDRIAHPDTPSRDILLDFTLMVRQSCGASLAAETQPRSYSFTDNAPLT